MAEVKTDRNTSRNRFIISYRRLSNAKEYEAKVKENYSIPNPKEREEIIVEQLKELEIKQNFKIIIEQDLLSEVRNLVEYPTVFYGSYEKHFLNLPSEVLITSMKEHQRYFP